MRFVVFELDCKVRETKDFSFFEFGYPTGEKAAGFCTQGLCIVCRTVSILLTMSGILQSRDPLIYLF